MQLFACCLNPMPVAKRGDWVRAARNCQRFRRRIEACAKVIEFCLEPVHRIKIRR